MTRSKKLKKAVRTRSRKTGESYTAARRQVLSARQKRVSETVSKPAPAAPPPLRSRSRGIVRGEAGVLKKTGHGYDHWFAVLDSFGAPAKGHKASAQHLYDEHGVPGWHAQMITVEYERDRGLRAVNQSCEGNFQVSASKVVGASVAEVAEALGDARRRLVWLQDADPELRRALNAAFEGPKAKKVTIRDANTARIRFRWDGSTVEIRFTGKGDGRASVGADNMSLPDSALVEKRRAQWRTALQSLKAYLEA